MFKDAKDLYFQIFISPNQMKAWLPLILHCTKKFKSTYENVENRRNYQHFTVSPALQRH